MAEHSQITRFRTALKRATAKIKQFYQRQPTERLVLVGALILLVALAIGMIMTALNNALFFDGYAEDGAFQLLNPLRRLMAGEILGRDFNFFHGVGVPLLHLPSYLLFGQGLFGEEMTRWTVSPVLFFVSALYFFYILRRRWAFALSMSAIVTAIGMIVIPFLVLPITSILGVRSVLPVFLLAIVLNQRRLIKPIFARSSEPLKALTWYELIVGVMLAASLLCGTEFGAGAIVAFFIVHIAYRASDEALRQRALSAARVLGVFIVALFGLLSLITLGHPLMPLKYALFEIPGDQFWYFGVPPNTFLHGGNVIEVLGRDWLLWIMLALALAAALLVRKVHRLKSFRVEVQALTFGLLAGMFAMVSMLGYYSDTEAAALTRMALLAGGAAFVILAGARRKPLALGVELGGLRRRTKLQPAQLWKGLAGLFVVGSLVYSVALLAFVKHNFDFFATVRKVKDYATGADTNVLSQRWRNIDEMIIPTIQADNNVAIADITKDGFVHGVSQDGAKAIIDPGDKASFVHHGQVVYFSKAGRQVIATAEKYADNLLAITVQDKGIKLDPAVDGAPNTLIVAEDFKHNNNKVWSFYTGVLNQEMGVLNPTHGGYDYIIHALGQQRRDDYLNDFKTIQPKFVTTFTHSYFPWEGWMENEHWDLYSLLDKNYEVVQETPVYALWKRKDQPWSNGALAQSWQPLKVTPGDTKISLPKPSFDNLPDVESYGQQLSQKEQDHLRYMGRPTRKESILDQTQYDTWLMGLFDADRLWALKTGENHGPETEDLKITLNEQRKEESKKAVNPTLHIPRPKRQIVLVKLRYKTTNILQGIPLIGGTMRSLVELNGVYSRTAVSLRPYANEIVFPVVISEYNDDPYLRLKTYTLLPNKGDLTITSAEWQPLDTTVANLKMLTD